jgi:signal transduction histidine kinase
LGNRIKSQLKETSKKMEKSVGNKKMRSSSFKLIISSWIDYIIPDKNERDPKFRNYLARLSSSGLLVAGILTIVGIILLMSIYMILGAKLMWIYKPGVSFPLPIVEKAIIFFIGIVCLILSRFHRDPQWGRLVIFILIITVCAASVWDDVVRGDISFSAAYLMLIMLVGVGAMPFRPWQVLMIGAIITISFYFLFRIFPIPEGLESAVPKANSFVVLIMATILSTIVTGAIYRSRVFLYRSRQKEIVLRKAVTEFASELNEINFKLRQTRDQLIQSKQMEALGNLVAGVAHEVNTPLGAINSNADTAQRALKIISSALESDDSLPWPEEKEEKVSRSLKTLSELHSSTVLAAGRIDKIIRALRGFACLDEAEFQTYDLHKGIDDTITLFTTNLEKQVEINRDFCVLPKISCNPGKLNQVFMNLLTNSVQAIEKKGVVTIRTHLEGEWVMIQFIDNGKGIPRQDLEHIFDPGFTSKGVGVGTGLGLSICYRILEDHGGSIDVSSEVDKGATFTIRLPVIMSDKIAEG